jgi:lipopolysaccharide/colanic/teichoic acid biosynthesis glycosyltransferase
MVTAFIEKARRFKRRNTQPQENRTMPLTITVTPTHYFQWKSIADFCLALLLLLPGLFLIGVAIVIVRLTSRGPGLFKQCRVGQNGQIFCLYKIRSMSIDAEARTGPAWAQAADPRVTRIGHLLRKFHIDELPQIFNVLKGEMSLVGPRPERPEFVDVLSRQLPAYQNRLAVRPGITGLAQLNLPPDSDMDSVRRKVILDIEYIQTAGLGMDLILIFCTALRFLRLPLLRIVGLSRDVKLPAQTTDNQQASAVKIVTLKQIEQKVRGPVSNSNGNGNCNGEYAHHYCKCKTPLSKPK